MRGWGVGKFEDVCKELSGWKFDVLGVCETHLRDDVRMDGCEYKMIGKGRKKQEKVGGGVAFLFRKEKNMKVEEIDVGSCASSEDVLAVRVKCMNRRGRAECVIMVLVYMTVEGERAVRENTEKYAIIRKVVREHRQERVIVMGDMNAHIGILGERMNRNGEMLVEFADETDLENLNETLAEGRVTWSARDQESAIDYMLVNERMRELVTRMWIDEDGMIDIVSDHNMLVMECMLYGNTGKKSGCKRKWRLRDVKWEDFQVDLSERSWVDGSVHGVDEINEKLIENIRDAAVSQIGFVRMNGRRRVCKPWWNDDIREARNERKRLNKVCRSLRKRRHESDENEAEYQNAWEAYVRQQRQTKRKIRDAKVKCERGVIQSLREKGVEGGREWYRFLRGEQMSDREDVESLKVNGVCVTDKQEMKVAIKEFWEDIGGVGEELNVRVDCVTLERKDANELNEEISRDEVVRCVRRQKNGKAAGPDDIPYEFYKNGGEVAIDRMTELFNRVWEEEKVPRKWNESRVILLHKGGHKNRKELRNYRPIALVNTVGKVFCAVLNERLCKWIERARVLGEEQNGFRVDRRAEDNMFIVNELIESKKKSGGKLYIGFLDIEKAYDRVNRSLMCAVLEKVGISEKIVNIVRSMYKDTRAKFTLGNLETDWVKSERGVRQGCILSPTLFSLYTEELAARVRRMNVGVKVGRDKIGMLLYADDVVVMSESAEEFQRILDVVDEYGRDFGVKFSSEKSQVMIVNRVDNEGNVRWKLGEDELKETNEYKYLGVWMSTNGCEKAKNEKISMSNQWVGRLGSAARIRTCKYDVLREVWKCVAVPSIMYGMDVMVWNESEIMKLEGGQNRVARMALNAPKYAAVEALRGDMGWSTFRERYIKATLRYKVRLEQMENARLARKVYLWNGSSRWVKRCMSMVNRNDMDIIWLYGGVGEGQVGHEWRMLHRNGEGHEWDVRKWKNVIDKEVRQVGLSKWKNDMERKKTLEWFKEKEAPMYVRWYDGSLGGDLLFRARAQCMDVNTRNYRWSESHSKVCQMCDRGEDETVEHVLLECETYSRERWVMMQVVLSELGCEENVLVERTGKEWLVLLLGLCKETTERMIVAVKEFLERMWSKRCRM